MGPAQSLPSVWGSPLLPAVVSRWLWPSLSPTPEAVEVPESRTQERGHTPGLALLSSSAPWEHLLFGVYVPDAWCFQMLEIRFHVHSLGSMGTWEDSLAGWAYRWTDESWSNFKVAFTECLALGQTVVWIGNWETICLYHLPSRGPSLVALVVKNPATNAGDLRNAGLISGWRRYSGGGLGNPLQYSCLENPMDRGAWWATVHRVTESRTGLKRLSAYAPL